MSDKDELTRRKPLAPMSRAPTPSSLPFEKEQRSLADQRADLQRQLEEVEGVLRFMGQSHPKQAETEAKRTQILQLLAHLDASEKKT